MLAKLLEKLVPPDPEREWRPLGWDGGTCGLRTEVRGYVRSEVALPSGGPVAEFVKNFDQGIKSFSTAQDFRDREKLTQFFGEFEIALKNLSKEFPRREFAHLRQEFAQLREFSLTRPPMIVDLWLREIGEEFKRKLLLLDQSTIRKEGSRPEVSDSKKFEHAAYDLSRVRRFAVYRKNAQNFQLKSAAKNFLENQDTTNKSELVTALRAIPSARSSNHAAVLDMNLQTIAEQCADFLEGMDFKSHARHTQRMALKMLGKLTECLALASEWESWNTPGAMLLPKNAMEEHRGSAKRSKAFESYFCEINIPYGLIHYPLTSAERANRIYGDPPALALNYHLWRASSRIEDINQTLRGLIKEIAPPDLKPLRLHQFDGAKPNGGGVMASDSVLREIVELQNKNLVGEDSTGGLASPIPFEVLKERVSTHHASVHLLTRGEEIVGAFVTSVGNKNLPKFAKELRSKIDPSGKVELILGDLIVTDPASAIQARHYGSNPFDMLLDAAEEHGLVRLDPFSAVTMFGICRSFPSPNLRAIEADKKRGGTVVPGVTYFDHDEGQAFIVLAKQLRAESKGILVY